MGEVRERWGVLISFKINISVNAGEMDQFMATRKFQPPILSEDFKYDELKQVMDEIQSTSVNHSEAGSSSSLDVFSGGVDPDITRMDTLMDQWLGDLKRNVLVSESVCTTTNLYGSYVAVKNRDHRVFMYFSLL